MTKQQQQRRAALAKAGKVVRRNAHEIKEGGKLMLKDFAEKFVGFMEKKVFIMPPENRHYDN